MESSSTGNKTCPKCQLDFSRADFISKGGYLKSYCPECTNRRGRTNYQTKIASLNPEELKAYRANEKERQEKYSYDSVKSRAWWVKYKYGMTLDEWDVLFEAQNGACAICKVVGKTLHIDHDHGCCPTTQKKYCGKCNRGLICFNCNTLLGVAHENTKIPLAALHYLEQY